MEYVISLKATKKFEVGFSYIKDNKEHPIVEIFKLYNEIDGFYSLCAKDALLYELFNDERVFEVSELSEDEFVYMLCNAEKIQSLGFQLRIASNITNKSKMTILLNESDTKLSTKILVDDCSVENVPLTNIMFLNGKWRLLDPDLINRLKAANNIVEILNVLQNKKDIIKSKNITIKNNSFKSDFKGDTKHFKGTLKHYQDKASKLLYSAFKSNKNILLADDMGLGKTITVISVLNMFNNDKCGNNLVIVPKSLTGNWCNEIKKFAPNISHKLVDGEFSLRENTYITTYGHVQHNPEIYQSIHWNLIVLDEAQAIKNHETKQSKLMCSLKCNHKVAMTGTPIENSLMDLWSIFKFLQPELLGSCDEFKKLLPTHENISFIQQAIRPFFIRRIKSDKSLSLNLPEKHEKTIYCDLNDEQAKLYNSTVAEFEKELKLKKRTSILKYIHILKLICSLPGAFDEQFEGNVPACKIDALVRYLITNKRQKIILFTQHLKVADKLHVILEKEYNQKGLLINGKITAKKRTEIASRFQSGHYPYIILTLRSGNCGLTLTEANKVIHFDRWWNPSVENQATDRSYRIGQNNDVEVVKFVCKGTLEERINDILENKTNLFKAVINPLSMNAEELMELVSYNPSP